MLWLHFVWIQKMEGIIGKNRGSPERDHPRIGVLLPKYFMKVNMEVVQKEWTFFILWTKSLFSGQHKNWVLRSEHQAIEPRWMWPLFEWHSLFVGGCHLERVEPNSFLELDENKKSGRIMSTGPSFRPIGQNGSILFGDPESGKCKSLPNLMTQRRLSCFKDRNDPQSDHSILSMRVRFSWWKSHSMRKTLGSKWRVTHQSDRSIDWSIRKLKERMVLLLMPRTRCCH